MQLRAGDWVQITQHVFTQHAGKQGRIVKFFMHGEVVYAMLKYKRGRRCGVPYIYAEVHNVKVIRKAKL